MCNRPSACAVGLSKVYLYRSVDPCLVHTSSGGSHRQAAGHPLSVSSVCALSLSPPSLPSPLYPLSISSFQFCLACAPQVVHTGKLLASGVSKQAQQGVRQGREKVKFSFWVMQVGAGVGGRSGWGTGSATSYQTSGFLLLNCGSATRAVRGALLASPMPPAHTLSPSHFWPSHFSPSHSSASHTCSGALPSCCRAALTARTGPPIADLTMRVTGRDGARAPRRASRTRLRKPRNRKVGFGV